MQDPFTVTRPQEGHRLDRALGFFFPDLGLRARRRLCERGAVLVDGHPARPGFRVRAGQQISLIHTRDRWDLEPLTRVAEVARSPYIVTLYKPLGLHTARLAGSEAPCVEDRLESLLGPIQGGYPALVNRLDHETSGLVVVALCAESAALWEQAENSGMVCKNYLALCHGRIEAPFLEATPLDTADRRVSRPLPEGDVSALRSTRVEPLAWLDSFTTPYGVTFEGPLTLAACRIFKGARHQIRVHLGLHNHPLAGDPLYGSPLEGPFFLHHACFGFNTFTARVQPEWLSCLPADIAERVLSWLNTVQPEPLTA